MTEYNQDRIANLLQRRDIIWNQVVAVIEVGSSAIGVSDSDTDDDLDLTVVYWEPDFYSLVWQAPDFTDKQLRTQPDGHRSRVGDIDINLYTVRRFARLILKANPSILGALWSPRVHHATADDWYTLRASATSRTTAIQPAGSAYLGYATQQIERWRGERGQKSVSRPELVEAHGYDTKYAYHAIRLAWQGIEYMRSGRLVLPISGDERDSLLQIRRGEVPEERALAMAEEGLDALRLAIANSKLPMHANSRGFGQDVARMYARRFSD